MTPRRWRRRPSSSVDRQLDPGVVGPVAGRPDHGVDVQLAAVGEADRAALGADGARPHLDAVALDLPRARADQGVAAPQASPEPRVDRLREQAELRQPPEEVAAEQPLRQRRLPGADREMHLVGRGELLRDLEAGVAAADHEHAALGDVRRAAVAGAVRLEHLAGEASGERRARSAPGTGPSRRQPGRRGSALVRLEHERVALASSASGPGSRARSAARKCSAYRSR